MTDILLSWEPVPLGRSGLSVAPIAWGMWRFAGAGLAEARQRVEAALAAGVTLFDTADIYGLDGPGFGEAEALLGRVFADSPGMRDRMVLATKGGITPPAPYDSSSTYLKQALDASLRRLGVEQVDLYQVHRPDVLAHPQEVARTLEDMVVSGKVRAVGVSNHTPAQHDALLALIDVPLATSQPEFSALHPEPIADGLLDRAMHHGFAVLAWSPLAGGRIARPADARARAVAAALDEVAGAAGVDRSAAAYAWIMAHPARPVPIVGTQDPGRIARIGDAFAVRWTRESWYAVLTAARGEPLP